MLVRWISGSARGEQCPDRKRSPQVAPAIRLEALGQREKTAVRLLSAVGLIDVHIAAHAHDCAENADHLSSEIGHQILGRRSEHAEHR